MPFDNLSGDEEQDYFSDGICDDIITDLSKIEGLVVIARNSSFRYRGKNEDVRQIARALGVRVLLKGSIRRDGDGVRINAQLIDPEARRHIWPNASTESSSISSHFRTRSRRVSRRRLKLQLASDTAAGVAARLPVSVTAHDHFLRGPSFCSSRSTTPRPFKIAKTISGGPSLDPNYGKPHAALAMAYLLDHQNGWSERSRTALDRARVAELAVRKAPSDLVGPPRRRSCRRFHGGIRTGGKGNQNRPSQLDPNHALSLSARGLGLLYGGNPREGIGHLERALRIDPAARERYLHFFGHGAPAFRQPQIAVSYFRDRIALVPETDVSRAYMASALGYLGRIGEAQAVWHELKEVNPDYSFDERIGKLPFRRREEVDILRNGLVLAGLVT